MRYAKDPDARTDYQMDWTLWLDGDTITDSTWIVPAGLTQDGSSFDDTTATIWLKGGTAGLEYTVTNRITTAAGRIDDRSLQIKVRER